VGSVSWGVWYMEGGMWPVAAGRWQVASGIGWPIS